MNWVAEICSDGTASKFRLKSDCGTYRISSYQWHRREKTKLYWVGFAYPGGHRITADYGLTKAQAIKEVEKISKGLSAK